MLVMTRMLLEAYLRRMSCLLFTQVSLFHHPLIQCMRDLDPQHIETLIGMRGIVIRCSSVIPEMRTAVFRCTSRQNPVSNPPTSTVLPVRGLKEMRAMCNLFFAIAYRVVLLKKKGGIFLRYASQTGALCGHEEVVQLVNSELQEPLQCVKCNAKYSFELVSRNSLSSSFLRSARFLISNLGSMRRRFFKA